MVYKCQLAWEANSCSLNRRNNEITVKSKDIQISESVYRFDFGMDCFNVFIGTKLSSFNYFTHSTHSELINMLIPRMSLRRGLTTCILLILRTHIFAWGWIRFTVTTNKNPINWIRELHITWGRGGGRIGMFTTCLNKKAKKFLVQISSTTPGGPVVVNILVKLTIASEWTS